MQLRRITMQRAVLDFAGLLAFDETDRVSNSIWVRPLTTTLTPSAVEP